MIIQQFFLEGLGCASYLVGSETQGTAAVVDPDRDIRPYLEAAQARGLCITHSIETHLHADHVSGSTDLAARTGAEIYIHEAARVEFPHQALKDGDEIQLGEVRIRVRHTPGHTPESVILLIGEALDERVDRVVLTGDMLFVGDVGRPDLVGPEAARLQAGQMFDSLSSVVLPLVDEVVVYPGHGAGSLCGRNLSSARSSTVGQERQFNPALAIQDRQEFVSYMTTNLPEQPGNFTRIKSINRRGSAPLGEIVFRPLSTRAAIPHFQRGAGLLDTRSKEAYIRMHVPGSVHLEADEHLSSRVGFVLPPDLPLVLLVDDEAAYRRVVISLARVGYENILGFLAEGIEGWAAMGLPVASGDVQDISPAQLAALVKEDPGLVVIDVREPWEWRQGHIEGAVLMPLGQLAARLHEIDSSQAVAVVCASGSRSLSAAALLGQKGIPKVYNLAEGMNGWEHEDLPVIRG
jgi:glyoxylase-like metal-dependent hydrolase (beta-lactamase superfamily II)/rhodanese-related sulfurtransferase